jgi:hypothetical protein
MLLYVVLNKGDMLPSSKIIGNVGVLTVTIQIIS